MSTHNMFYKENQKKYRLRIIKYSAHEVLCCMATLAEWLAF